jgi:hypothetical protein
MAREKEDAQFGGARRRGGVAHSRGLVNNQRGNPNSTGFRH